MAVPAVVLDSNNDRPHHPIPVFENSPTFQMAWRQLQTAANRHTESLTKAIQAVFDGRKSYSFTLRWGEARDTDDAEGRVTATSPVRPEACQRPSQASCASQ